MNLYILAGCEGGAVREERFTSLPVSVYLSVCLSVCVCVCVSPSLPPSRPRCLMKLPFSCFPFHLSSLHPRFVFPCICPLLFISFLAKLLGILFLLDTAGHTENEEAQCATNTQHSRLISSTRSRMTLT